MLNVLLRTAMAITVLVPVMAPPASASTAPKIESAQVNANGTIV